MSLDEVVVRTMDSAGAWSLPRHSNPFAAATPEPREPRDAPTVEVRSCHDCPARADSTSHPYCRLAGRRVNFAMAHAPAGCPLRGGPVALRLVDRGRP